MNILQPFKLIDTPDNLTCLVDSSKILLAIEEALHTDDHVRLQRLLLRACYYPEVFSAAFSVFPQCRESLLAQVPSLTHAANIAFSDPKLFTFFAEKILNNPDTLEQVFWFRFTDGAPAIPPTLDDVIERLKEYPERYARALAHCRHDEFTAYIDTLPENSEANYKRTPYWLLAWIQTHEHEDLPLPESLLDVLAQDEYCLFRAAWSLRNDTYSLSTFEPLAGRITSPRWAYHFLRHGLAGQYASACRRLLLNDPAWLVDYWQAVPPSIEVFHDDYQVCAENVPDHPLMPEFHHWFQAATYAHSWSIQASAHS